MSEAMRQEGLAVPHPSRYSRKAKGYESAMAADAAAIDAGEGGYFDPRTGLFVLTAVYLAARGTCCDSGCRHCPYVGA